MNNFQSLIRYSFQVLTIKMFLLSTGLVLLILNTNRYGHWFSLLQLDCAEAGDPQDDDDD